MGIVKKNNAKNNNEKNNIQKERYTVTLSKLVLMLSVNGIDFVKTIKTGITTTMQRLLLLVFV